MENKGERVFDEDIAARIVKHSKDTALNPDKDEASPRGEIDAPFSRRSARGFPVGILLSISALLIVLLLIGSDLRIREKKNKRRRLF